MGQRLRRELFVLIFIIMGSIMPALIGLFIAGFLYTKGWPEGFCIPFGIVSIAASVFSAFVCISFGADSKALAAWIEEPPKQKKIKEASKLKLAERQPRYGAWKDE